MSYQISINSDREICNIVVNGIYDGELANEIREAGVKIVIEEKVYKFLVDCRKAELIASFVTLYEYAHEILEKLDAYKVPIHKIKRAFVIEKQRENFEFYETVSVNRGLNVRAFYNIEEARDWLKSS